LKPARHERRSGGSASRPERNASRKDQPEVLIEAQAQAPRTGWFRPRRWLTHPPRPRERAGLGPRARPYGNRTGMQCVE
jgi:hypothetical protein